MYGTTLAGLRTGQKYTSDWRDIVSSQLMNRLKKFGLFFERVRYGYKHNRKSKSIFYTDLPAVKRRLDYALEAAQLGIWEWNPSKNQTIWTEEQNKFFGFPPGTEKVNSDAIFNRIHPEDLPQVQEAIENVRKHGGQSFSTIFRVISESGQKKWILGKGRIVETTPGDFNRVVGINMDVTEIKNTEEKLQAALHFSEKVVGAYPAHVFILNLQSAKFAFVNRTMADFHGVDTSEMLKWDGSKISSKFHPEDRDRIRQGQALMTQLKDGDMMVDEFRLIDKTGQSHWMQSQVIVFNRDPKTGAVMEVIGAAVDISRLKLVQEELNRAREQAENANQLKSAFLANMSHEIRTPLGIILGYSELVRDTAISASERDTYLDIISKNGEQLSGLINDILDLSKVESGELNTELVSFDLKKTLLEIIEPLMMQAREKGLEFNFQIEDAAPDRIVSDPLRFRQIVLNIVSNAIKFTQDGKVEVLVYQKTSENNEKIVFVEVRDSGIGIAPENISKLFKPFSQLDYSMTRKYGGTGLGLALSQRLARTLGGDLILKESHMGKGSTFLISICDQSVQDRPIKKDQTKIQTLPEPTTSRLKNIHVLVVDDSEDNQHLVKLLLSKEEATVDVASNGSEAVQKILNNGYDIILMDVQMPIMDGYTATTKLRQKGFRKPIIALTAHALSDMRAKSLTMGCDDHLTKPINPQELVEKIRLYTRRARSP